MKITVALSMLLALVSTSAFAVGHHKVKSYYRKDGTYVQGHERTNPNNTQTDNYGYPGNYNPNNGSISTGETWDTYQPTYTDQN